jgi:hypothetical protein
LGLLLLLLLLLALMLLGELGSPRLGTLRASGCLPAMTAPW